MAKPTFFSRQASGNFRCLSQIKFLIHHIGGPRRVGVVFLPAHRVIFVQVLHRFFG